MAAASILMLCCTAWALGQEPSPTATQDKEAEQLGERLVRRAVNQADEDVMETVLRLMNEATRKLEIEFDAGQETQTLQSRILERLDEAIRLAASQRRASRRRQSQWIGEKRKNPSRPNEKGKEESGPRAQSDRSTDSEAATGPAVRQEVESLKGDMRELRRAWGLLPERQRDQIIQGSGEDFLERYREWIERYYRALQEAEQ